MNDDIPCKELDEIISFISRELWKRTYLSLIKKVQNFEPESNITARDTIVKFRNELMELAKKENLSYKEINMGYKHVGISLEPYPINIGISTDYKNPGDFWISAPHISIRNFKAANYKAGIKWIQEYFIDSVKTNKEIQDIYKHYYVSPKNAEIIKVSIQSLCDKIVSSKKWSYKLNQNRTMSKILIQTSNPNNEVFEILIYHTPFTENPSILIDLLNNPKETTIFNVAKCDKKDCFNEVSELSYFGIFTDYFFGNIII